MALADCMSKAQQITLLLLLHFLNRTKYYFLGIKIKHLICELIDSTAKK